LSIPLQSKISVTEKKTGIKQKGMEMQSKLFMRFTTQPKHCSWQQLVYRDKQERSSL